MKYCEKAIYAAFLLNSSRLGALRRQFRFTRISTISETEMSCCKSVMTTRNRDGTLFEKHHLLEDIASTLHLAGLPAENLEIEICEGTIMPNVANASHILNNIRTVGVYLTIDDFGTGFSSLSRLQEFSVQRLKIDRSFVRGLPQDGKRAATCRAIIALGRALNLKIVAEGIETAEQARFFQDHDCDELQGYFFAKPASYDIFDKWLDGKGDRR